MRMDNGELIIENAAEGNGLFEHFVRPAQAGIQVTDTFRHTVEERYPGRMMGLDFRVRGNDGITD